eukprot:SAG31_NODE_9551_length_1259_cov_49.154310_1_plen_116_part_00
MAEAGEATPKGVVVEFQLRQQSYDESGPRHLGASWPSSIQTIVGALCSCTIQVLLLVLLLVLLVTLLLIGACSCRRRNIFEDVYGVGVRGGYEAMFEDITATRAISSSCLCAAFI